MIKKIISSIVITLLFVTNVFAADTTISINIDNKVATIKLDGISDNIHALQLNLTDENGNTDIKFTPFTSYTYSYIDEKNENGVTTISIVIDNGGALTENGTLNIGDLTFNNTPKLSNNVSLELVNLDDDLTGNTLDLTADITIKEEDNSNNNDNNNDNNNNDNNNNSNNNNTSSNNGFSGGGASVNSPSSDEKTEITTQNSNQEENTNNQDNNSNIDIDSIYPIVKQSNFSDINTHWASDSIKFLADRGIINGMSDTEFAPNNNITRAEFITLLAKLDNINENKYKTENFTDVPSNAWFNPYVDWASKTGITSGTSNATFAPNDNITREQMAVMIERFCEYKQFSLNNNKEVINFTDNSHISSYAQNAVTKVQQAGIINGRTDGSFAPKDNATRAEAAQIIYTMLTIQ